jgi:hypothetical protein
MKSLDLTDEEEAALAIELTDITWNDRYSLSSRIRVLEEIFEMLRWRAWLRPGFDRVLSRGGSRLRLVLALPRADRPTCRSAGCAIGWVRERDRVKQSILALALSLTLLAEATGAYGQTKGPIAMPALTIYSRPTPAPLAPPVNPGPAVVPPAGLSPLLTEPGPVSPPPQRAMPVYPSLQLPGPVGQQNMQAYRNSLLGQKWQRERSGISPGSERSREIQQQLNQTSPQ